MFPPGISGRVGVQPLRARSIHHRLGVAGAAEANHRSPVTAPDFRRPSLKLEQASRFSNCSSSSASSGSWVLIAPAFTTIKGGTDVTSAAYTIKGVLDTARTYAKANNTYAWVGFSGSIGSTVTGNVALCVVASKDGTDLGTSVNQVGNRIDITTGVTPVGKVMRLDNAHIGDTGTPTNDGTDFESRAAVNINYRIGAAGTQVQFRLLFYRAGNAVRPLDSVQPAR